MDFEFLVNGLTGDGIGIATDVNLEFAGASTHSFEGGEKERERRKEKRSHRASRHVFFKWQVGQGTGYYLLL